MSRNTSIWTCILDFHRTVEAWHHHSRGRVPLGSQTEWHHLPTQDGESLMWSPMEHTLKEWQTDGGLDSLRCEVMTVTVSLTKRPKVTPSACVQWGSLDNQKSHRVLLSAVEDWEITRNFRKIIIATCSPFESLGTPAPQQRLYRNYSCFWGRRSQGRVGALA